MSDIKGKIGTVLVYISLVAILLLLACIYPYKEVLTCRNDSCTVERQYLLFKNRDDTIYYFNRADDIRVNYHHSTGRHSMSYYEIENASDYDFNIFENSFAGRGTPKKMVSKIKSNDNNIKITKYWLGHKIEK